MITVKPSAYNYLKKVQNNIFLLKGVNHAVRTAV